MIIIGLTGDAGVGKDTVADYLVRAFGFVKFAFSDALYREVQTAYSLPNQDLLRNRETKEVPTERLSLVNCLDDEFIGVAVQQMTSGLRYPHALPLSPRQVLQLWGTEYRRAQDDYYWLNRAQDVIVGMRDLYRYPEQAPQYFVETGTRFENERQWIRHEHGPQGCNDIWQGNIWHIHRDSVSTRDSHASSQPLPVLDGERELWNNDTIERLYKGIDLLMTNQVRYVRVEPMNPIVPLMADGVTLANRVATEE